MIEKVNYRMEKVNALLQKLISELILTEYDAEGDFIVVKAVDTARDLSLARIYISALQDPQKHVTELNYKARELKKLLRPHLHMRTIPNLEFKVDEKGEEIEFVEEFLG